MVLIHGASVAARGLWQSIAEGEEAGLGCLGVRSRRSRLTTLDLGFLLPV